MRTKTYRKKLMADLKSASKNCIENEKKFVGQCNIFLLSQNILFFKSRKKEFLKFLSKVLI